MSALDFVGFGDGHPDLDKDARRRKSERDARFRRANALRENWSDADRELERAFIAYQIENWADRKAA